jgi:autophagy-related protein 27
MKLARLSWGEGAALLALLAAPVPAWAQLDCSRIVIEGKRFDFSNLRGPHSVLTSEYDALANTYHNTTYTLDLCGTLKRKDDSTKVCPAGTRGKLGLV